MRSNDLPGDERSAGRTDHADEARHVAIIMDGNARWAADRGTSTLEGHRAGAQALERIVRSAVEQGIRELTVYAFSTENWARPAGEIEGLMSLLGELLGSEVPELQNQGVRVRFVGRGAGIPAALGQRMRRAEEMTAANSRMTLFVAFNYGGRAEIVDAARGFAAGGEEQFARLLYAPEMHDPDLLIRTSGERRLSNFLLWQCAYSELVFSDKLWPDFDAEDLREALSEYRARQRRFGTRE